MKKNKYIAEIAQKLPIVYYETLSGYELDSEGNPKANIFTNEVNHERRLRKAYQSHGLDGIKAYLSQIHKLQIERNEKLSKDNQDQHKPMDSDRDRDQPVHPDTVHPVQGNQEVLVSDNGGGDETDALHPESDERKKTKKSSPKKSSSQKSGKKGGTKKEE